ALEMATVSLPNAAAIAIHRLRQGFVALRPATVDEHAAIRAAKLSPEQVAAFASLANFDRRHLCRVLEALRQAGVDDVDLLQAALLHDLGKRSPHGQVRLIQRATRVLLGRLAPSLLARLSRMPASPWRLGLALAVHHPQLGAEEAARLGCSPRTCWLIAHHEDRPAADDPAMAMLIACDERTP
ncbi:MAG: hypothetical protein ACRDJH_23840, partial [Thermomicrobiales bacterium]